MNIQSLRQRALFLIGIGAVWNVFEAVVALWSALTVTSVALLAYGLDSVIEIFAGTMLLWRFWKEREDEDKVVEKKAIRVIGITFFILAAFIIFQSSATFLGWLARPQESLSGILLTISSAVIMTILFVYKSKLAVQLGSRALRAEAYESLICDLQDVVVLIGLGLNSVFGWWWADPLMALMLIPLLVKEGWESIHG
ncbi:MAG: cation transporter [Candidatus Bathyarchaeota archaeon]|nr:MAG: cation transporter [Candidatus Bathyarchaeota archaeon]